MKKAIKLFILMVIANSGSAQTQMRHWFIAPERVNMQVTPPAPAPIPGAATPVNMQVANGFYDNAGNLLFYIANTSVFDKNNTLLGNIPNGGSEVIIVPFGDNDHVTNCKLKFNIFTTSAGISQPVGLYQTVLDMNSYSLITNEIDNMPFGNEFGAIAVSRIFNQVRFLYFMTASGTTNAITGQINKLTINHNGNVTSNGILYPTPSLPNSNAGADIFSQELEISPDGRWLAWSSFHNASINGQFRYHFIALDPISPINPGGLDLTVAGGNPYHEFNINGTNFNNSNNGFRGIEFWQGNGATKLFMGAGNDGVFWENISIPFIQNPVPIAVTGSAGTNGFGFSQIEFAFNGKMYATSGLSTNNVGGFDPSVLNPSMQNYFTLSNPPEATWSGAMLYTLPDQIDGQDYSNIIPLSFSSVPSLNNITFNSSSTGTWTYASGANPWGATADPVQVIDKITVDGNSTLIINGMKIKFSLQAGFIIKKGSKVILDGTTLTSNYIDECNIAYTWKGVRVEGDINTSQNTTNGQGKITLMNNSVIEYAECAAKNWDGTNSNTTGGIIIANPGTVFRNNKVDVELRPYPNFPSYAYKAGFSGCSFETDFKYPFPSAPKHVIINGCKGVAFSACTFSLNSSLPALLSMKSVGIKAIDGGFTVYNNSQFSNLWHGIDASRWNTNTPFYVYYSTFTDNQVGILANTINNIVVQRCTLEIGGNANVSVTNQVGLSLKTCSGYTIEENIFRLSSGNITPGSKQGTNINNSLAADNQIYKNKYIGLTNGNVAIGVNRDNAFPTLHGLQYLCNWHESVTAYDIFIAKQVGFTPFGIRATQGTGSAPAGNTFSHLGPVGVPTDIFTKASGFTYYYWTGDPLQEPLYFNAPDITISSVTTPPNTCPSHICDPPCALAQEITMLSGDYDTAETAYLDLLYTYNSLMDGGNTNALLTQIQQTWSNEAVQLYNDLISQSPYLSEEVLIETANRNILPPTLLLAVCVANPDATRSYALLNHLQYEIANPLTQYMIDMIIASWDLHTSRTIMESTLAHYSYQMANASDHILASLHFSAEENDPTDNHAQIIYWLTRVQTLTAKYELIEIHLAEHNYTSAQIILDSIPFWFRLSEDQSAAYNDYVYFYNYRKALYQNQSDLSQLDTSQIQELANFVLPLDNFAKALAQNVLCHFYNICIEEDYELDYSGERIMYNNSTSGNMHTTDQANNSFKVAPNPATNTATFKYHLAPGNEYSKLIILDITGKTIANFTLSDLQGEIIWDIGKANDGSYFYLVKNGNETLAKGQIAVKK